MRIQKPNAAPNRAPPINTRTEGIEPPYVAIALFVPRVEAVADALVLGTTSLEVMVTTRPEDDEEVEEVAEDGGRVEVTKKVAVLVLSVVSVLVLVVEDETEESVVVDVDVDSL